MNSSSHPNPEQYISIPDYARQLGVSRITVYNRVKSGQIPAKKVGRNYVILCSGAEGLAQDAASSGESGAHISIAELAKRLGITRIAVYQRIRSGKIPATKAGRNYIISSQDIPHISPAPTKIELTHVKNYISIPELAKQLGVSRVDIWQKVKSGRIRAEKIGRNYVIDQQTIGQGVQESDQGSQHLSEEYISIPELARQLNVSRITVFNRVKRGEIKAKKIGRNYVIRKSDCKGVNIV